MVGLAMLLVFVGSLGMVMKWILTDPEVPHKGKATRMSIEDELVDSYKILDDHDRARRDEFETRMAQRGLLKPGYNPKRGRWEMVGCF